jgi:hypothetical protein
MTAAKAAPPDISTRVTSLVKPFGSFAAGWQVAAQFASSHKSPYAGRKGP